MINNYSLSEIALAGLWALAPLKYITSPAQAYRALIAETGRVGDADNDLGAKLRYIITGYHIISRNRLNQLIWSAHRFYNITDRFQTTRRMLKGSTHRNLYVIPYSHKQYRQSAPKLKASILRARPFNLHDVYNLRLRFSLILRDALADHSRIVNNISYY